MRGLIKCYDQSFFKWSQGFAQRWPNYRQKDGTLAFGHVLRAVEAEGFDEINGENIDQVKAALEARAQRKSNPA